MKGTLVRNFDAAGLRGLGRDERIRVLKNQMAAIGASGDVRVGARPVAGQGEILAADGIIPVPGLLAGVFPGGGLARRTVSLMNACPPLAMQLLLHAALQGCDVGVVGWPDLCFAEMSEYPEVFSHVVCVPNPGLEPLSVAVTLGEGLDLVLCYAPGMEVTPSRARPLLAKLRRGAASIILVGAEMMGAAARIRGVVLGFYGSGQGAGRIRTVALKVEVRGRGGSASVTFDIGAPMLQQHSKLRAV